MDAVAYRRWSFTRGFNCKALTGKMLVFSIGCSLWETIAYYRRGGCTWRFYCHVLYFDGTQTFQKISSWSHIIFSLEIRQILSPFIIRYLLTTTEFEQRRFLSPRKGQNLTLFRQEGLMRPHDFKGYLPNFDSNFFAKFTFFSSLKKHFISPGQCTLLVCVFKSSVDKQIIKFYFCLCLFHEKRTTVFTHFDSLLITEHIFILRSVNSKFKS